MERIAVFLKICVILVALSACGKVASPDTAFGQLNPPGEPATSDVSGENNPIVSTETVSSEVSNENTTVTQVSTNMVLTPGS